MGGGVYGGYAESELGSTSADSNTATVTDSIIESGGVYGGYANTFGESTSATADNNTVTVSGSAVEEDGVYGGFAFAYGESNSATADNNTVTVSGNSTTNVNVYGGYADAEDASSSATANNNTVNIIDSDIQGSVYGAGTSFLSTYTPSLSAFNNTVTLAGATNVEGDVFGAYNNYAGGNLDTGRNTLNIRRPKAGGITVGGDLGNFEYLNFYLPEYFTAGGIMLKVAGDADIDGSEVYLGFEGSRTLLKAGDTVTLLSARNQLASPASTRVQGQSGATLRYDFNIYTQGNELLATVASMSLMEQTKALSEGFLGGMGLMIMGADTLADQGIAGAVDAAKVGAAREGSGLAGFGTVSGGRMRYNTGSHVDVSGFSLLAGLSLGQDLTPGRLTLGAFFRVRPG
ncbi:MAG: hypothetical protein LBQ51_00180 [Desulfovibrio sp.]|jgi:hypothetical protein|nr:hypothetical protein [Desulfovibrio sp.]